MDLKQLEYIIAIAEEQSIAKAAQKLFMTQSGLNQQLLKLERELGLPLFHRIKHGMVPTYAGTIYLETARKMLMMKQETYRLLQDIADMKKGEIAIAYTPEQGSRMFSHIYPIFHRMYPDITFKIYEARVKQGEQLLLRGSVNIAFVSHALDDRKPQFDYFLMSEELLVFGVCHIHPVQKIFSRGGAVQYPDDVHQGGFTGSGLPYDCQEFSPMYRQIDAVEDFQFVGLPYVEGFHDPVHLDDEILWGLFCRKRGFGMEIILLGHFATCTAVPSAISSPVATI